MLRPAPLVHETTTTGGADQLTLVNENGKQNFSAAYGTGAANTFPYYIAHRTASEWEYGEGYMLSATVLYRLTPRESSAGAGVAVNFSAGTKDVSSDYSPRGIANEQLAQMPASTLKGNAGGALADPSDLTPAQARALLNVAEGANNYVHPNHTGHVTSVGDGALTIVPGIVDNSRLAAMTGGYMKGRITEGVGDPENLSVGQVRALLVLGNLAYLNTVNRNQIDDNEVTTTKLQDMLDSYMIGRASGAGTGDPTYLNSTQVRALLNVANGANNYVHPNHTGDVTSVGDGALTIGTDKVTNLHLANMVQGTIKGRAAGAGTNDPQDLTAAQVMSILGIVAGQYAPTITAVSNISGTPTATAANYMQIGNVCLVSGQFTADANVEAATRIDLSLPVPSAFSGIFHCAGCATSSAFLRVAAVSADLTNDRARVDWTPAAGDPALVFSYIYAYRVI